MLAEHIEANATWDDIVLPEPEAALLRQIAAQVAARTRSTTTGAFAPG